VPKVFGVHDKATISQFFVGEKIVPFLLKNPEKIIFREENTFPNRNRFLATVKSRHRGVFLLVVENPAR
jgi:hypothetical protein